MTDRNQVLYTVAHNFLFSASSQEAMRLLAENLGDRVFGRSRSLFAKSTLIRTSGETARMQVVGV
ncbi:TPA: hypothetical protein EYN65_12125 [Candidatus Poribacteria bacterium]|nr:hypothetical protein [Candidatus Poribacteria bacterium]